MKLFFIIVAAILVAFTIWFGGKALVDQNAQTQSALRDLQSENAKAERTLKIIKQLEHE